MKHLLAVKGSRRQRMVIYLETILLGILFYWACGFLINDLRQVPAPNYEQISKQYISENLSTQSKDLNKKQQNLSENITRLTEQRDRLAQSTQSVKATIEQLSEQEKIRVGAGKELTADEQKTKHDSMTLFLENQKQDQQLTQAIIQANKERQSIASQAEVVDQQIAKQREPADKAYQKELQQYYWRVAGMQIALLATMLVVSALLIRRFAESRFRPILLALFIAIFVQTVMVIHEYFPSVYFKYVLVAALIVITIHLLLRAINNAESKQLEVLLKRYRDAYLYFVCPTCEYPIRRGPMKYLFWTRRSITKMTQLMENSHKDKSEPYICPACGTDLFEPCPECQGIRHTLLPSCEHCGAKQEVKVVDAAE